ncbi:MAG: cell division protein FtsA [Candidatus Pacebacteria bacterium]|jgi:cell division protein FtsA|nr:cell division protein FtsA [bacterium]MDP6527745.1 cell division protein FtsA [Candidatus Paceibacterota bacterium]MDP6659872.1 cell division protein FtsA [Candidatus Paceibacterota bacterium]|tara:strand:- start:21071 stop:22237 length:1167 start_codon:yes stop_codon:yes gene_type:complete
MSRNIITGIDIGTFQVKALITEHIKGKDRHFPRIIGSGQAESKGLRHGYIINTEDAKRSIRQALSQAEKEAGVQAKTAYISIGGVGLDEVHSTGEVVISRADLEVVDLDIKKAIDDSTEKAENKILNRKILHEIPLQYKIDGEKVLGRPVGMHGGKLETDVLFITALEQHLNDLIQSVEDAGVEVIDVMATPIAASLVSLTKAQKKAGCILANIGSETVSIVVFEDSVPVSLKVFPIGSTDITNDIALGLKVSLEEAEQIKKGAITNTSFTKKKLDDIIAARLSDIFELIEKHLKDINKNGLLPAGIIITGGGSGITTIEDLAKATLKLPSRVATLKVAEHAKVRDASWAVAYGLTIWGLTGDEEPVGLQFAKRTGGNLANWLKQFLP